MKIPAQIYFDVSQAEWNNWEKKIIHEQFFINNISGILAMQAFKVNIRAQVLKFMFEMFGFLRKGSEVLIMQT